MNWNDPYWSWPVYGYDDYAPGYDLYYGTGDYDNNPSYNYDSAPPENYPAIDQNASPEQSAPQTVAPGNSTPPVVVYMKDGSAYSVSQYWVADGKLHYIQPGGTESTMDINQLDLQRTVDVNAQSGVPFTLTPSPEYSSTPAQVQP